MVYYSNYQLNEIVFDYKRIGGIIIRRIYTIKERKKIYFVFILFVNNISIEKQTENKFLFIQSSYHSHRPIDMGRKNGAFSNREFRRRNNC